MNAGDSCATRIIIVEDNPSDEELLLRQLERAGLAAHVRVINDGEHALNCLQESNDELLAMFLDLHVPRRSGLDVLKKVRASSRFNLLPVVIMTSSNHPDEMDQCRTFGNRGLCAEAGNFRHLFKSDRRHLPSAGQLPAKARSWCGKADAGRDYSLMAKVAGFTFLTLLLPVV